MGGIFNSFECLGGINPFLFSQLCLYHYAKISKEHNFGVHSIYHQTDNDIQSTPPNWLTWLQKVQPSLLRKDGLIGQVAIGNRHQHICIPRNSTVTIPECTNKLPPRTTYLVEQGEHHNLSLGILANQCMAIPKARVIPVLIINANKYNVLVRQPLLAAKLYDTECDPVEYRATMDWEGENITIRFQPVPP